MKILGALMQNNYSWQSLSRLFILDQFMVLLQEDQVDLDLMNINIFEIYIPTGNQIISIIIYTLSNVSNLY